MRGWGLIILSIHRIPNEMVMSESGLESEAVLVRNSADLGPANS